MLHAGVLDPDDDVKVLCLSVLHVDFVDLGRAVQTCKAVRDTVREEHPAGAFLFSDSAASSSSELGIVGAAVEFGNVQALEWLCRAGVGGSFPLHLAASLDRPACIPALVECGAAVDELDSHEKTALMTACVSGHELCTRALIEARANVEFTTQNYTTALMFAAENGRVPCVRALLEANAVVEDEGRHGGETALMRASGAGQELCIRALLEANADVDGRDWHGNTALMCASDSGHDRCVEALLGANANMDYANIENYTALMLARENKHTLCVRALRKRRRQLTPK